MLLDGRENRCILEVLGILDKGKSKYGKMFKETKVSHTTLQRVLKYLVKKRFIKKSDIGHMKVDYEITTKGRKLLKLLADLKTTLE